MGCVRSVLGILRGHKSTCELRSRIKVVEERELITGVHTRISKAKIIREGARLGQVMRPSSSLQCTQNHVHCTKAWAVLLGTSRSQKRSLGEHKEEGAGADAAQTEVDTDGPGGEEHGLEFPISAVLYES